MEIKRRYTLPNRLSDVIRLISVLALHKYDFKDEGGLTQALRGNPSSVPNKTWQEIVDFHPEFFRTNGSKDHWALVIRSFSELVPDQRNQNTMLRRPLTIAETQALIGFATTLYDKEVEHFKKTGRWVPIGVAVISLMGTLLGTMLTIWNVNSTNADTNKIINSMKDSLQKVNMKIDKLPHK